VLEQVEQRGVGPLDVLVEKKSRLLSRQCLNEPSSREEQDLAICDVRLGVQPDEQRDVLGDFLCVVGLDQRRNRFGELLMRQIRAVVLEDSRQVLDLMAKGQIRATHSV
jgi:hypothetical protein